MTDASLILDALGKRSFDGSYGIARASDYLKAFAGCLGDGFCPRSAAGISPDEWVGVMKDAESKLVYCGKGMNIKDTFAASDSKSMMEFECVITTTLKDRDGDILETSGATLDPAAPLLWQHNPLLPLGKVLRRTGQSSTKMTARCGIAAFEGNGELAALARDAATLVEFNALRISHGFEPEDFEPLDDKGGRYRILKFTVLEASLVSIPSNVQAIITAVSRGKLYSPLAKSWAQHYFDNRPAMIQAGVSFDEKPPAGFGSLDEFYCSTEEVELNAA